MGLTERVSELAESDGTEARQEGLRPVTRPWLLLISIGLILRRAQDAFNGHCWAIWCTNG